MSCDVGEEPERLENKQGCDVGEATEMFGNKL